MSTKEFEKKLDAVQERLGAEFCDRGLLQLALTHTSYRPEQDPKKTNNNQRLEYLGDAVLEWVIIEFLLKKFPEDPGKARRYKGLLVSNNLLGKIAARDLRLGEVMLFDQNQQVSDKAAADAFEALIGAIYLDQGLGACRLVVDAYLHARLTQFIAEDGVSRRERRRR